jgi:hypothetical protein
MASSGTNVVLNVAHEEVNVAPKVQNATHDIDLVSETLAIQDLMDLHDQIIPNQVIRDDVHPVHAAALVSGHRDVDISMSSAMPISESATTVVSPVFEPVAEVEPLVTTNVSMQETEDVLSDKGSDWAMVPLAPPPVHVVFLHLLANRVAIPLSETVQEESALGKRPWSHAFDSDSFFEDAHSASSDSVVPCHKVFPSQKYGSVADRTNVSCDKETMFPSQNIEASFVFSSCSPSPGAKGRKNKKKHQLLLILPSVVLPAVWL